MIRLYVKYDYKSGHPELSGRRLTDALIRECLDAEDILIERTEKGKPFLTGPGACGRHISVSHSEGTFALAVSEANIGMDIQYPRNVDTGRIASRCFTEEEAAQVGVDRTGRKFYELWTRKEACSKYTGVGLEQIMKRYGAPVAGDIIYFTFELEDGCFCSICTGAADNEGGCEPDEIQISYRE